MRKYINIDSISQNLFFITETITDIKLRSDVVRLEVLSMHFFFLGHEEG
jgi:hypothetical protein